MCVMLSGKAFTCTLVELRARTRDAIGTVSLSCRCYLCTRSSS